MTQGTDTQHELREVMHRWIQLYTSGDWTIAGRDWPDFVRRLNPWGEVGGDPEAVEFLTAQVCSIPDVMVEALGR